MPVSWLLTAALALGPAVADERVTVVPVGEQGGAGAPTPTDADPGQSAQDAAEPEPAEPEQRRRRGAKDPPRSWQAQIFVDVAYGFNSNWPDNKVFRGMFTNPRTGELAVNSVGGFIRHQASEAEPWWFELGLHAGAAVDALTENEPIPGGPDGRYAGREVFKHIALANAGLRIRKSKTSLGAGVFEGPTGIGSFWTVTNWNYTTTWESNIVPYYLAGAKIAQELPAGFELSGWLVNGFQSYADLNSVPSGQVGLSWGRGPRPVAPPRSGETEIHAATHVYFGPEGVNLAPQDWLVYWDTWVDWDFDDHFSLAGVWDLAVDRPGRGEDLRSLYTGGALFVRGTVYEGEVAVIDLALRPEASWDRDGRFYGVDQWLIAGTLTANLQLWNHMLLRAEYRYDYSTAQNGFFYRREFTNDAAIPLARDQHTVFLALTAWWEFWFGRRAKP